MSMTVTCPSCSDSFPVDPAKIPAGGIKARCSSCQGIIDISPPAVEAPAAPAEEEAAAPEETPSPMGDDAVIETPAATEGMDEFGEREVTFDEPLEPAAPEPETATPEPETTEPMADAAPATPAEEAPAAEPAVPPAPESPTDDADSAFAAIAEDGAGADAPTADEPSEPAAAPIQFGKRSPEDKAKSLARSLVSDIIAYHTDKHAEAKAAGTLPQVFEEEVEKCWKEYQEQVDPGVVQNNPFLTDALNDILADGEPVFNLPG